MVCQTYVLQTGGFQERWESRKRQRQFRQPQARGLIAGFGEITGREDDEDDDDNNSGGAGLLRLFIFAWCQKSGKLSRPMSSHFCSSSLMMKRYGLQSLLRCMWKSNAQAWASTTAFCRGKGRKDHQNEASKGRNISTSCVRGCSKYKLPFIIVSPPREALQKNSFC